MDTRIVDRRTSLVLTTGFARDVPKHVARKAQWIMTVLLAARGWQDVGVIDRVTRWSKYPGRYGLHVAQKWYVSFTFEPDIGPREIRLERH